MNFFNQFTAFCVAHLRPSAVRSLAIAAALAFCVTNARGETDTTAPVLTLPANIIVGAATGDGSVVVFAPTAADAVDPDPNVVSVPASGSVFPIGTTTVNVTATDASGNQSKGSFTVKVRDLVPPTLVLTSPKADQSVSGKDLIFKGRATDDRAVARVEIVLNKETAKTQSVLPPAGIITKDFVWTLAVIPETGLNSAVVTAYDRFGNPSPSSTVSFNFVNVRPLLAGNYNGLLTATEASLSPIDHEGLVNVTVLSTGTFTGKVTLSGTVFPITGIFLRDGAARFGDTSTPSLELIKTALPADISLGKLSLTLDPAMPGTDRITGKLTQGTTTLVNVALLDHADHALYTIKKHPAPPFLNLPLTIFDPRAEKGRYTALFPAGTVPNKGVSDFPPGDGFATVSVGPGGNVRIVGKMADGAQFSYGSSLSKANELPFYTLLYSKTGLLSGPLRFDPSQSETDASAAGLRWYKRANPLGLLYRAGWPEGIALDMAVSKYVIWAPEVGLNALSIPGAIPPASNATLALAGGGLTRVLSSDISVAANSRCTVIKPTRGFSYADELKLTINPATGVVAGSFFYPHSTQAVPFSGRVYQKTHVASGFFLYFPTAVSGSPVPVGIGGAMSIQTVPGTPAP